MPRQKRSEALRKASVKIASAEHRRWDEEDLHPARLDPAEAELERALDEDD